MELHGSTVYLSTEEQQTFGLPPALPVARAVAMAVWLADEANFWNGCAQAMGRPSPTPAVMKQYQLFMDSQKLSKVAGDLLYFSLGSDLGMSDCAGDT